MVRGSIDSFETFGLVDGPGIRTVVFLNGCSLRCKFCHNPETWQIRELNYDVSDIVKKALRSKPYYKNNGGVTFSGGEPLLQYDFVLECCKELKKQGIHVALDTAGIGNGNYDELLSNVDLVLLDVKHITREGFIDITGRDFMDKYMEFIASLNKSSKEVWIRQVIVPGIHDNLEYVLNLSKFIKENIKNVTKVEFLPFHRLGEEKYDTLNILYPYKDKMDANKDKCEQLHEIFLEDFEK